MFKRAFLTPPPKKPAISLPTLPLPSSYRLESSLSETSFDPSSPSKPETVLYLAYGSNLCYETFQGNRGIRPLSAINVLVPSLKLTFDLPGFPYTEPCFANTARIGTDAPSPELEATVLPDESTVLIEKRTKAPGLLIGVVYEVTAADYAHIIATEGPTYTDVVVECHALSTPRSATPSDIPASPFKAHTLLAPPKAVRHSPSGLPAEASLRYLTLCRNGAAEHELPAEWQGYLNALQPYEARTAGQKVGRAVFMMTFGPVLIMTMMIRRKFADDEGKSPKWTGKLINTVFKSMWFAYDHFFSKVFGNGERAEGEK